MNLRERSDASVRSVVRGLQQLLPSTFLARYSYLFSRMQQQDEPGPEAGGKTRNPKIAAS
jgi:hypothetical protein